MKFLILLILLAAELFAAPTLPDYFQAAFVQKVTNPKGKVIRYTGSVYFAEGRRLKWVYLEPTRKEVCTDGKELIVVDHDLEQVSYYLMDEGFDLIAILKRAKQHKARIYLADYQGSRYTIQVDGNGIVQSVAYFDNLDNKIQIVFKEMRYGKKRIKGSDMRCKAPKNYDVIRG